MSTGPRGDRQRPPPPADDVGIHPLEGGDGTHHVRFWIGDDPAKKRYRLVPWPAEGDVIVALEETHRSCKPGAGPEQMCGGYVSFDPAVCELYDIHHSGHTLVSLEPLHVEASLLCRCGSHGWIRDGAWSDA